VSRADRPDHRRRVATTSRRRIRMQRCTPDGKIRFRDKREATRALHIATAARRRAEALGRQSTRRERRAYPCSVCKGWHLTSQPSPRATNRDAKAEHSGIPVATILPTQLQSVSGLNQTAR
jgi:hypothetical protein